MTFTFVTFILILINVSFNYFTDINNETIFTLFHTIYRTIMIYCTNILPIYNVFFLEKIKDSKTNNKYIILNKICKVNVSVTRIHSIHRNQGRETTILKAQRISN